MGQSAWIFVNSILKMSFYLLLYLLHTPILITWPHQKSHLLNLISNALQGTTLLTWMTFWEQEWEYFLHWWCNRAINWQLISWSFLLNNFHHNNFFLAACLKFMYIVMALLSQYRQVWWMNSKDLEKNMLISDQKGSFSHWCYQKDDKFLQSRFMWNYLLN